MLTTADITKAANDDRWLGFGYLAGRQNTLTSTDPESPAKPDLVAVIDSEVIHFANEAGWTYEDLFAWANSKTGRWFADVVFSGGTFPQALGWNLIRKVGA